MSIVLPEVSRGRIVGIIGRAVFRGDSGWECSCGSCLSASADEAGTGQHNGRLFASIEAVAEHWEIGANWT